MTKNELLELCKELETNNTRLMISSKDGKTYWSLHTFILEGLKVNCLAITKYHSEFENGLSSYETIYHRQIPYIRDNQVVEDNLEKALELLKEPESLIEAQLMDVEGIKSGASDEVLYILNYLIPKLKQNKK